MNKEFSEKKPTAAQIARNELAAEQLEKDVKRLKNIYRQLATAEQVVVNLQREVADLEEAIAEGN